MENQSIYPHLAKGNYIVTVQDNYNKISRKIIKK
ncbi:T9SS type A sorting domain-containing protein [Riemerella anatipestifer]